MNLTKSFTPWRLRAMVAVTCACSLLLGCNQAQYRQQADEEVYQVIAERNADPRWSIDNASIEPNRLSRFYDDQDPDHSPMPIDDPASQRYMEEVNGIKAWEGWTEKGTRTYLENPKWRKGLSEYTQVSDDGTVELTIDSALRLAYMHSSLHQTNLENLYLSSLDVTAQRFRLDTQFFGGSGTSYVHRGDISPVAIAYSAPLGSYVVNGPFERPESNRFSIPTDLQARRRLATAGEVLVGFANSFTWDFSGSDASLGSSLANFSFVQPLLRGAGKKIALEQLTQSERRLLANLRAYAQFRQGFFTQVAIGELGVNGPQRFGSSTQLQSFSGFGGIGGYLGLIQQAQQITNSEATLRLQRRTEKRLQALYDNDLTDIVNLDQFKQRVKSTTASLLQQQNGYELALDNYKTQIMGLPPELPITVDDSMLKGFQLVPVEANEIIESLNQLQERIGWLSQVVELQGQLSSLESSAAELPGFSSEQLKDFIDRQARLIALLSDGLTPPDASGPIDSLDEQQVFEQIDQLTQWENNLRQITQRLRPSGDTSTSGEVNQGESGEAEKEIESNGRSLGSEDLEALRAAFNFCDHLAEVAFSSVDARQRLKEIIARAQAQIAPVESMQQLAETELHRLEELSAERERGMDREQVLEFREVLSSVRKRLDDLNTGENSIASGLTDLEEIQKQAASQSVEISLSDLSGWVQNFSQVTERLSFIPARVRLELITVPEVELTNARAFEIALENRLDFMNGRAALVDRWRAIEIAANELESNLSITGNLDLGTAKNNMLDFRGGTGNLQLGVEFDAPLARLLERNGYRETLIDFQRARRQFIQSRDSLQKGLRALLRNLQLRREQLEIQRGAVAIALRRSEQTQLQLMAPPARIGVGQGSSINSNQAFNLGISQESLLRSNNDLLAAWLDHYAARLRLYRELGIMELDAEGRWIENPLKLESDRDSQSEDTDPSQGFSNMQDTDQERSATGARTREATFEVQQEYSPKIRSAARPEVLEIQVR
ncbi:MAG: TolC family protein [Rubripirellula sp.]